MEYIQKKYNELDSWIAELTPGTYNVEVDCTGVTADQFKGDWNNSHPSPFGIKLSKAKPDVFFNLKFGFPDNITDVSSCFENDGPEKVDCIKTINITSAKGVTNAGWMFSHCTGLTSIDTSAFTQVTNTHSMFRGCSGLTSIDTSGFTQVTNAQSMFYNCSKLTSIDTSAFTKVANAYEMFAGCTSLSTLYANNDIFFTNNPDLTIPTITKVITKPEFKENLSSKVNPSAKFFHIAPSSSKYTYEVVNENKEDIFYPKNKYIDGDLEITGKITGKITGNDELNNNLIRYSDIGNTVTLIANDEESSKSMLPKLPNEKKYKLISKEYVIGDKI